VSGTDRRQTAVGLPGNDVSTVKQEGRSPRIKHVSWGQLDVEGQAEPYKDAKLFPGGSRDWNWRETGTGHDPGIQIADVQELLEHEISTHVLPTKEAVALYNKLAETEPVGGLFHTTC
jgi:hypothetical protein